MASGPPFIKVAPTDENFTDLEAREQYRAFYGFYDLRNFFGRRGYNTYQAGITGENLPPDYYGWIYGDDPLVKENLSEGTTFFSRLQESLIYEANTIDSESSTGFNNGFWQLCVDHQILIGPGDAFGFRYCDEIDAEGQPILKYGASLIQANTPSQHRGAARGDYSGVWLLEDLAAIIPVLESLDGSCQCDASDIVILCTCDYDCICDSDVTCVCDSDDICTCDYDCSCDSDWIGLGMCGCDSDGQYTFECACDSDYEGGECICDYDCNCDSDSYCPCDADCAYDVICLGDWDLGGTA